MGSSKTWRLGRYEIVGRIASGGMATVYRARRRGAGGFDREFALKVIHPHLTETEGFIERFLDEARLTSRLHHPNVCSTIDVDEDRGYRFLVLELIDGVTLRQLQMMHSQVLAPEEAAIVVADAARGLDAVHRLTDDEGRPLDVVHRDLSPHNLMLDTTGRTVLIDLGLAEARDKLGHTATGVLCGKLPYMSPEQSLLLPLDRRSDVFSLGSVLYELATGELPFGDDHSPDTLHRLRSCDTAALRERLDALRVPSWLSAQIARCLQRDVEGRPETATALADALDAEMHHRGVDVSALRSRLGDFAHAVGEAVGGDSEAEPLPPRLGAADRSRGRPLWAYFAAGATLVASAAFVSALYAPGLGARSSSDDTARPSLSVDRGDPTAAFGTAPAREPPASRAAPTIPLSEPSPASTANTPDVDTDGDTDGALEAEARPRKKRPRKRKPTPEPDKPALKSNPY